MPMDWFVQFLWFPDDWQNEIIIIINHDMPIKIL